MERQEVMQLIEEKLKELNLDNQFDVFNREHNPLDGTHKKVIQWDDIQGKPSSFDSSGHSHSDLYYTETEIDAALDITNKIIKTTAKCRAYLGTEQTNFTDATIVTVMIDTVDYDPGSDFDTGNYCYELPVDGYYLVLGQVHLTGHANDLFEVMIYKDATMQAKVSDLSADDPSDEWIQVSDIIEGTAGEKIYLKVYVEVGGNTCDVHDGADDSFLAVHLFRRNKMGLGLMGTANTAGTAAAGAAAGGGLPWNIMLPILLSFFSSQFGGGNDPEVDAILQKLEMDKMGQSLQGMGLTPNYRSPNIGALDDVSLQAILNQMNRSKNWGWPEGKQLDMSFIGDLLGDLGGGSGGTRNIRRGL